MGSGQGTAEPHQHRNPVLSIYGQWTGVGIRETCGLVARFTKAISPYCSTNEGLGTFPPLRKRTSFGTH